MKLSLLNSSDFLKNYISTPVYALGKYLGTVVIDDNTSLFFYNHVNIGIKLYPEAFINKNYILKPFHCYLIVNKNHDLEIVKCIGKGTVILPINENYVAESYRFD